MFVYFPVGVDCVPWPEGIISWALMTRSRTSRRQRRARAPLCNGVGLGGYWAVKSPWMALPPQTLFWPCPRQSCLDRSLPEIVLKTSVAGSLEGLRAKMCPSQEHRSRFRGPVEKRHTVDVQRTLPTDILREATRMARSALLIGSYKTKAVMYFGGKMHENAGKSHTQEVHL